MSSIFLKLLFLCLLPSSLSCFLSRPLIPSTMVTQILPQAMATQLLLVRELAPPRGEEVVQQRALVDVPELPDHAVHVLGGWTGGSTE